MTAKSDLIRDAYTKGQACWREHPGERDDIFKGYGYTPVATDGYWAFGPELSSFVPVEMPSEKWWMTSFGQIKWRERGPNLAPGFVATPIHIVGYVSPPGTHGHLGQYDREVLVMSYTLVKTNAD